MWLDSNRIYITHNTDRPRSRTGPGRVERIASLALFVGRAPFSLPPAGLSQSGMYFMIPRSLRGRRGGIPGARCRPLGDLSYMRSPYRNRGRSEICGLAAWPSPALGMVLKGSVLECCRTRSFSTAGKRQRQASPITYIITISEPRTADFSSLAGGPWTMTMMIRACEQSYHATPPSENPLQLFAGHVLFVGVR